MMKALAISDLSNWVLRGLTGFLVCVSLNTPATAQDSALQALDTWGSNRGWEAVGLLAIAGQSTCTGVMIRSDLVLTAAHCLYDLDNAKMMDPRKIEFRAGWRDGKSVAKRFGKSAIIHSGFVNGSRDNGDQIRNDIGLLQLFDQIPTTHVDPFRTGGGVATGNTVSVVSYGAGRNSTPSLQKQCEVLETHEGLVAMSCDVVSGSSGSPVFAMHQGRPRVVSVVSSIGRVDGQKVSYGMDLREPLSELMADFRAGRGVFPSVSFGARKIGVGSSRESGGALFLRP